MSMVCTATGGRADVCNLSCCRRPCGCLGSMPSPKTTWKSTLCAPLTVKDKGASCAEVDDCRLTVESETLEGFMTTSPPTTPPQRNNTDKKPLKRT